MVTGAFFLPCSKTRQDKPLFNVKNTVLCYQLDSTPPKYVLETLSLGPKNSILDRFDQNDILAELDGLINYCKEKNVEDAIITDINIKTLAYIKKCKKQHTTRNLSLTKRYLKENKLLAVPFDKGVGICLMKITTYDQKIMDILSLPQFEKVISTRKNAKNPVLKEEEKICKLLEKLKRDNEISDALFLKLKPIGSQPPRLYGLAKIHKNGIPIRPVLSMPGSPYFNIAKQIADWLSAVPECKIDSSTKEIADQLADIVLEDDKEMVSFDVVSLYTNVPVDEAIEVCANLLYDGTLKKPPINKNTFTKLLNVCSKNVIMSTNDGLFRQIDGLAMGSPPAPMLANAWMSTFDAAISNDAVLYTRYMDDILRDINKNAIDQKLEEINSLHPSLKFTVERETNCCTIPFLDMKITRSENKLESSWYTKDTYWFTNEFSRSRSIKV
ncbi:uncharacterized protein [Clytia hemisphaerica]|uniref:uncharacterized protein n=1 Tax=Clytia hemisphaerica TaxID=252671 RepID=UPI0034D73138